ncbi:MAG: oxygenase MpaB family protein [Rhodobacteraceae bacterium]|nr:oxygenase MpaB family protein [Paracoccaceae bacterium]
MDAAGADRYLAHVNVGDPLADRMISDLSDFDQNYVERLIRHHIMNFPGSEFKDAPASVGEFFEASRAVPPWVDFDSFQAGCRLFHGNTRLVLAGMVGGVLIEGFSTTIARSFFLTGRLRDRGSRRLRQNNRHMLEIFIPGGMRNGCDGWAHSVRIRLVHARLRFMFNASSEWDSDELGVPLSAANLGFAIASFSARLLYHIKRLGAVSNKEERASFMQIWRYSGYLMGIPETILFADQEEADYIFKIGLACEPPPSMESIVLAASLINSAPLFAGMNEPDQREKYAKYIARISRALIGDQMADDLMYDQANTFGILWKFRVIGKIERFLGSFLPIQKYVNNMTTILDVSMFDEDGIGYKLPNHIFSEKSDGW